MEKKNKGYKVEPKNWIKTKNILYDVAKIYSKIFLKPHYFEKSEIDIYENNHNIILQTEMNKYNESYCVEAMNDCSNLSIVIREYDNHNGNEILHIVQYKNTLLIVYLEDGGDYITFSWLFDDSNKDLPYTFTEVSKLIRLPDVGNTYGTLKLYEHSIHVEDYDDNNELEKFAHKIFKNLKYDIEVKKNIIYFNERNEA